MSIILKKDGFYFNKWFYDEEADHGEYIETLVDLDFELLQHWNKELKIEGEITLKEFLRMLLQEEEPLLTCIELLTDCNIRPFLSEIDKPRSEDDKKDTAQLEYINIYKYIETIDLRSYGGDFEVKHGVHCDGIAKDEDIAYALEFTPLCDLKHLPIKINPKALVCLEGKSQFSLWERIKGFLRRQKFWHKQKKYDASITLGEFMEALFIEICFFGSPERRDEKMKDLSKSMKEIEDGTAKLIPWEDVREKLDKKREELKEDDD